ncbi:SCO2400 family protein [Streptomyces sp. NPDC003703]|uniref:SCO2400 family protein n=1 Tax=Streptomyces sp. NPDC003283 TaxID=3364681 RepID=UPI00369BA8BB
MDYCSTCRRHLNGALVCPGCGAYAPDIAPNATTDSAHAYAPGPAAAATRETAPPDAPVTAEVPRVPGGTNLSGPSDVPDLPDLPEVRQRPGRAARRRQLARWKKTQRRALVATAVALVGGGLTVASMERGGGDRAQAAAPAQDGPHPDSVGRQPAGHGSAPAAGTGSAPGRTPGTGFSGVRHSSPPAAPAHHLSAPAGQGVRPDAAAPPAPVAPSAPATHPAPAGPSGTSAEGGTSGTGGTPAAHDSPDTPAQHPSTGPTTPQGTPPGHGSTDPSSPPAADPASPQLCLLVLCLG